MALTVDVSSLRRALALLHDDGDGPYLSGEFLDLNADVLLGSVQDGTHAELSRHLSDILSSLWVLGTVLYRFERDRDFVIRGELPEMIWRQFAAADIEQFHLEFRSLFDYLARSIASWSSRPGQIPTSFQGLRNWLLRGDGNSARLGSEMAALVKRCDWFDEARRIRDAVVHQGAMTVVTRVGGGPAFQIHNQGGRLLSIPALMANQNLVRCDLYSAVLLGNALAFLEEIALVARTQLHIPRHNASSRLTGLGLGLLRQRLETMLASVDQAKKTEVDDREER